MIGVIADLGTSDLCHGWPGLGTYLGTQAAHTVIGALAVFTPLALRLIILTGWIGKELFADIAGCDLSASVALDSLADLLFAVLGFALTRWTLKQEKLHE